MIQTITKCDLCGSEIHGLECGHSEAYCKDDSNTVLQVVSLPRGWMVVRSIHVICEDCVSALRAELWVKS